MWQNTRKPGDANPPFNPRYPIVRYLYRPSSPQYRIHNRTRVALPADLPRIREDPDARPINRRCHVLDIFEHNHGALAP